MQPPNNKEAEQSLLASLICDPSMYHIVAGLVTADSFYVTKHQYVYNAIEQLIKDDVPIDVISLSDKLNGRIDRADLLKIIDAQPTGANAEYYAGVVAEKATRRKTIDALNQAISDAQKGDAEILDVITTAQKELDINLPSGRINSNINTEIRDVMAELIELPDAQKLRYVPTGFEKPDKQAKLLPGTLTMIAADSGVGKTSYCLDAARYQAKHGYRPLIITLEMTRRQIIENIIAQELLICHRDMISGLLTNDQYNKLSTGLATFADLNIGVLDGRWSTGQIRHQVVTEVRTNGIDCLYVDSLGKVEHRSKNPDRLNIAYNDICADLVDIAVEFQIPVVVTHHLNKAETRRGKDSRPTIYSLNEAGDRWTHNVFLLYREFLITQDQDVKDRAELTVAKARDGETGVVILGFDGPSKTFRNVEHYREPPGDDTVWRGGKQ